MGAVAEVKWDWIPALIAGSLVGGYIGAHTSIQSGNLQLSDCMRSLPCWWALAALGLSKRRLGLGSISVAQIPAPAPVAESSSASVIKVISTISELAAGLRFTVTSGRALWSTVMLSGSAYPVLMSTPFNSGIAQFVQLGQGLATIAEINPGFGQLRVKVEALRLNQTGERV